MNLAPHDLRRDAACSIIADPARNFVMSCCWRTFPSKLRRDTSAASHESEDRSTITSALSCEGCRVGQ